MPPPGRMLALALVLSIVSACSSSPSASEAAPGGDQSADPCAPWDCAQLARFDAATTFLAGQKGRLAIVVKDRTTGAVWRAGDESLRAWAGSTPKLALAVMVKEETRAGSVKLSARDESDIHAMLEVSDNQSADRLWNRYANNAAVMDRWQKVYGMSTASYVDGFERRWGFVKCTPLDLINLMSYVLEKLDRTDRAYIVDEMRTVGPPQQWGVWGAGPALLPGVKNGWDYAAESGENVFRWVTATVGFVGPDERYVVGAMYDQVPGGDTIDAGVHVLTDLVAIVFGAPVPAPAVVPEDY
jgi:hypothetical protein